MSRIPENVRHAFEETDWHLNRLRGLLTALDVLNEETPRADEGSPQSDACCVLIQEARAKLQEVDRLRQIEWVANGGNSQSLSTDEIAQARGK